MDKALVSNLLPALAAGLIVTGWQTYKDTPWEGFLWRRYIRTYLVVFLLLLPMRFYGLAPVNLGILTLVLIGCERAFGDVYKGFFRPSIHPEFKALFERFGWKLLFKYQLRFITGIGVLVGVFFLVTFAFGALVTLLIRLLGQNAVTGMLIGLLAGTLSATGGAIKDSQFEGFKPRKFIRSPLVGALGGMLVTSSVHEGAIVAWSLIGYERVVVELYKTFWRRQVRGIFEKMKPKHSQWLEKRAIFFGQYGIGVMILVVLWWGK